jgi:hypothetical protein
MKKYIATAIILFIFIIIIKNKYMLKDTDIDNFKKNIHTQKYTNREIKENSDQYENISLFSAFKKQFYSDKNNINIDIYSNCKNCLRELSKIIIDKNKNLEEKKIAAIFLAKINTRDSIITLMNSLNKSNLDFDEITEVSHNAIKEINQDNLGLLTKFLIGEAIGNKKIPFNQYIKNEIYDHIYSENPEILKNELVNLFNNTDNLDIKNNIIDLENTEVLQQIIEKAIDQKNIDLENKIITKLDFSHNMNSLDTLIDINEKYYKNDELWLSENITQWLESNAYNGGYEKIKEYSNNLNISKNTQEDIVSTLKKLYSSTDKSELKSQINTAISAYNNKN